MSKIARKARPVKGTNRSSRPQITRLQAMFAENSAPAIIAVFLAVITLVAMSRVVTINLYLFAK